MVPSFPVYLFDVDGTLLDSAADICAAQCDVLSARGVTGLSHVQLRPYIGRHLIDLFSDLGFAGADIDAMVEHYRAIYPLRCHASTTVYPGVAAMLGALGGRKSTATTKGTKTTRAVLEQFGLIAHFDHVQGTDGFPAKPEPDVLLRSAEALGARPEECLFIGDSAADMEAGRRAGMRVCAVRWGYGDQKEMARWQPDYWVDEPSQLVAASTHAR